MEPSESPGELKPCREEISALLREYSVKTKPSTHTLRTHSYFNFNNEKREGTNSVYYKQIQSCFSVLGSRRRFRLTSRIVGGGHA